jgi:hypothetical protein
MSAFEIALFAAFGSGVGILVAWIVLFALVRFVSRKEKP